MLSAKSLVHISLATLVAAIVSSPATASDTMFDSASLEFGTTSKARMVRLGAQSQWDKRWFVSNGTHLSGYWDLSLAQWRGTAYRNVPGENQNITNLGFTPVFRFQADNKLGWYAEGGIGLNLLSKRYDNDGSELSTHFQFGDHVGAGYVFANRWDLGLKVQHFSNGGYKKPNDGVNFLVLKAARAF
ncbi:acyloxyacyl hydrolase [Massilia sp. RP-1-19]|uniref:Lipid A deacylase n=1 Tax=Massilia polaris TaxID=2728846 RepID=A0A848HHL2_9BURK|nr:acyloxyacyl hydrolase [Massilia polaris]NML61356.1 acyloxyacyl hydrolase [Massilia polaris]